MTGIIIWGKRAVIEAVRAGAPIREILIYEQLEQKHLLLKELGGLSQRVREVDRRTLEQFSGTDKPGGIAASVVSPQPVELESVLRRISAHGRPAFLLVLDHIEDPHNLGAIFRAADTAGVDAVIFSNRRNAPMSGVTISASSGACFHVPFVMPANIAQTLDLLKKHHIWVVGTAVDGGEPYTRLDMTLPVAIVLGAEGTGMRPLVRNKCDFLAYIPMKGRVDSLNVSQCAAILLHDVVRQRESTGHAD